LSAQGLKVICYEEGVQFWPLGVRCQALLAGALCVLDSTKDEFAQDFQRSLRQVQQEEAAKREDAERTQGVMKQLGIVGQSAAMMAVVRWVFRAAAVNDMPILITGETGTGKELLAQAIYRLDLKRCGGPYVALNCGAVGAGVAESELFGHQRGAFTGAVRDRPGLIRSAEGGILFLDEIGELDSTLQVKLLRVLQENRVRSVGEDEEVKVDVRVLAATNRDLEQMVHQGNFRADLFHRLNVLSVRVPPLRERLADLEPLIQHFLSKYRALLHARPLAVAPEFVEALAQFGLPGNVRELENLVRRALINKSDDAPLSLRDLPPELWSHLSQQDNLALCPSKPPGEASNTLKSTPQESQQDVSSVLAGLLENHGWNLARCLRLCERHLVEAALQVSHGNQSQAARLLGITPRSVYNKICKHHLSR
jgi:transcriptional regulator with GAF, ATPase, and Fis domain